MSTSGKRWFYEVYTPLNHLHLVRTFSIYYRVFAIAAVTIEYVNKEGTVYNEAQKTEQQLEILARENKTLHNQMNID